MMLVGVVCALIAVVGLVVKILNCTTQCLRCLRRYIYDEATSALTTTISANITSRGIETPLGKIILSLFSLLLLLLLPLLLLLLLLLVD